MAGKKQGDTPQKKSLRAFSSEIDRFLVDITTFEDPSRKAFKEKMCSELKNFYEISEDLKRNDLNPEIFQAKSAHEQADKKISNYINDKYLKKKIGEHKVFSGIVLNNIFDSGNHHSERLSFETIERTGFKDIANKNKRKFAKGWNLSPINERNRNHEIEKKGKKIEGKNNSNYSTGTSTEEDLKNVDLINQRKKLKRLSELNIFVKKDEDYVEGEFDKYYQNVSKKFDYKKDIRKNRNSIVDLSFLQENHKYFNLFK